MISLLGVALMSLIPAILRGPLLASRIMNASGAVGDLAALWQLRRLPADVLIADTNSGSESYARDDMQSATTVVVTK